ncbi:hypothetical protein KJ633_04650 [bacterium]|nr:hypothetical protein [bacterium]MBU3955731.1 hypothetical protein [bacterium]
MSKKIAVVSALMFVAVLFSGCAFIAEKTRGKTGVGGGLVTGGVASLAVTGPTRGSVGEVVTFEAKGYDSRQARIKRPGAVNPDWTVDDDSKLLIKLNSSKGSKITAQLLAPGSATIRVKQDKADSITTIVIQ